MSLSGILPILKPRGLTSHAVVSTLRRLTHMKKIGHAGTLDPDAHGLLLLCLGKATKISDHIMGGEKTYIVKFQLGVETNTYDSTGEVLAEKPVEVTEQDVSEALKGFRGEILQLAPPFSAVKVKGKKLYEYARRGEEVERPNRKIQIHRLELKEFSGNEGKLEIDCSKGTYVRSLVHDLGQVLGCGGMTTDIFRTRSGHFEIGRAVALEKLLELDDPLEEIQAHLLSIADALPFLPKLQLDARSRQKVVHGNALGERELVSCKWGERIDGPKDPILILDEEREALAMGSYDGRALVKVSRVF